MTTPPANATEAVAKPVPPEGYRLITDAEKLHPLPDDVLCAWLGGTDGKTTWHPSAHRGAKLPECHLSYHYATTYPPAQPPPSGPTAALAEIDAAAFLPTSAMTGIKTSGTGAVVRAEFARELVLRLTGPTAGDSMDVHLQAAKERIEELEAELTTVKWERDTALESRRGHIANAEERLVRAEKAEAALTTAETKAGAMEERVKELEVLLLKVELKDPESIIRATVASMAVASEQRSKIPKDLHPATRNLIYRFAHALADKMAEAEKKYGYSDGWLRDDWKDDLTKRLLEHVHKGDPRDVAAFCAFAWHHGWSIALPPAPSVASEKEGKGESDSTEIIETIRLRLEAIQDEFQEDGEPWDMARAMFMSARDGLAELNLFAPPTP